MTTRLALEKDISTLEKMHTDMGQGSTVGEALRERLFPPWILVVRETAGIIDGFYTGLVMLAERQTLIGPGDGPHESHQAWIKAICEMGLAIEAELTLRHPLEDKSLWWTVTRIWPSMGPLRNTIETTFAFKKRANASQEGFDVIPDATKPQSEWGRAYWMRRLNLAAKATTVRAAL